MRMVEFSCRHGILGRCLSEWGLHVADWRAARKGAEKGSKTHTDCSVENWPWDFRRVKGDLGP